MNYMSHPTVLETSTVFSVEADQRSIHRASRKRSLSKEKLGSDCELRSECGLTWLNVQRSLIRNLKISTFFALITTAVALWLGWMSPTSGFAFFVGTALANVLAARDIASVRPVALAPSSQAGMYE